MKNNLTEVVFILDASGSMAGLRSDTVGGVNTVLQQQREEKEGQVLVTTVLFNTKTRTVHDRIPLCEVADLNERDYFPCGGTALLDAVGKTLTHVEKVHHYIRPEDVPQKTLVVIMTDGEENSSVTYNYPAVKKLVEERQAAGWEFLFLAANIDAAEHSAQLGIKMGRAVDWVPDKKGQNLAFKGVGRVMRCARQVADIDAKIDEELFEVREDFKKRGEQNEK